MIYLSNEAGSKVEVDVAMCPLLSLFRREESRDGDDYVPYALHSYRSTATPFIGDHLLTCFANLLCITLTPSNKLQVYRHEIKGKC